MFKKFDVTPSLYIVQSISPMERGPRAALIKEWSYSMGNATTGGEEYCNDIFIGFYFTRIPQNNNCQQGQTFDQAWNRIGFRSTALLLMALESVI